MTLDAREFRDALSAFGTGVTIVTAPDSNGDPVGMTASSFNSVSTDPALILWSVTKTARSAEIFRNAKHFAVHVLGADQINMSNKFARAGEDKFNNIEYENDPNDVPILAGCCARFDCKLWATYEGGDHWIIVGHVQHFERNKAEGLLFAGGSYAVSSPIPQNKKAGKIQEKASGHADQMLIYHLSRAYHHMTDDFQALVRKENLSIPEWRILASLEGEGTKYKLEELSKLTFIRKDALKDMLYSMQDEGLCRYRREEHSITITGTTKGHNVVKNLFASAEDYEAAAMAGLSDKQAVELREVLKKIVSNTNK